MKMNLILTLLTAHGLLLTSSLGQIPNLVNYQGRLLDTGGTPVNSNVVVAICIYTNDTGGTSLYTENVGSVPVINGIYSFAFGGGGSAVAQSTELVAVTDGTSLSFSTTVSNAPMRMGSVVVADSTYTWNDITGSSNPSEFLATANHASGQVNVFYLSGAPASGQGISVTYDYDVAADLSAALANPEAWLEVKIDGVPLMPRQRLVAVPYARIAGSAAALGSVLADDPAQASPAAGSIRWTGSAFEGFNGIAWVPLSGSILVSPEMVTVGNPGNADDPGSNGLSGADTNSGAVAYTYKIGKYEVTNTEYTQFLNAVDTSGANFLILYNTNMNNSSHGGISNNTSGAVGGKYVVKPGFADKPVVYISFYDAMRFCNWLHNGAIKDGDTENGAYTLSGGTAIPPNGLNVQRNAGAKFALPTEDEWYKAAYYEPGGDADDYWLYPTRGNSSPNTGFPPANPPAANHSAIVTSVTDVGAYNTTEAFYGTFDMAGNVSEWTETRIGISRVSRGGSWASISILLQSNFPFLFTPMEESSQTGFRIASP